MKAELWLPLAGEGSAVSGSALIVNGKPRRFEVRDGFAVLTVKGGDWKCQIKN